MTKGGRWEPRGPHGDLDRVRQESRYLDSLVDLYLTEFLQSFKGRCYLATSVMLGVAAEGACLVMAQSYASSLVAGAPAMPKELGKLRGNYFALWTEFRKCIEPVRHELHEGLADALTLDAIADLIRQTRKEVGHPPGEGSMRTRLAHICKLPRSIPARSTSCRITSDGTSVREQP